MGSWASTGSLAEEGRVAIPIEVLFRRRVHCIPLVLPLDAFLLVELVILEAIVEVDFHSLHLFLAHPGEFFQLTPQQPLHSHKTPDPRIEILVDEIHAPLVHFVEDGLDLLGGAHSVVLDTLPTRLEVALLRRTAPRTCLPAPPLLRWRATPPTPVRCSS